MATTRKRTPLTPASTADDPSSAHAPHDRFNPPSVHTIAAPPSLLHRLGLLGLESIEPVVLASLVTADPLLLIGVHGSAKSLLLERLAQALDLSWRHYNASLLNFDDLVGYPLPDASGQLRFIQTPASIWGAQAVFIDEISRARIDIQNRLFPIIHEKRVQGLPLPELRFRWAAMNPPGLRDEESDFDTYTGSEPLDLALADRFAFHVQMPDWRQFGEHLQEDVILAHQHTPDPMVATDLARTLNQARQMLDWVGQQWTRPLARYVRLLCALLETAGSTPSARRAGMLVRNSVAVHAVRMTQDRGADIGDSVWLAVRHAMPFAASGLRLDAGKLLACHREAWRLAALEPDNPMAAILSERDPVERVRKALRVPSLPGGELTTLVTDALSTLPCGARHALAQWLFEFGALSRLSVVAADETAGLYRDLTCVVPLKDQARTGSQRFKLWQAIEQHLATLDPEKVVDTHLANLIVLQFGLKRINDLSEVQTLEATYRHTAEQLGLIPASNRPTEATS